MGGGGGVMGTNPKGVVFVFQRLSFKQRYLCQEEKKTKLRKCKVFIDPQRKAGGEYL